MCCFCVDSVRRPRSQQLGAGAASRMMFCDTPGSRTGLAGWPQRVRQHVAGIASLFSVLAQAYVKFLHSKHWFAGWSEMQPAPELRAHVCDEHDDGTMMPPLLSLRACWEREPCPTTLLLHGCTLCPSGDRNVKQNVTEWLGFESPDARGRAREQRKFRSLQSAETGRT